MKKSRKRRPKEVDPANGRALRFYSSTTSITVVCTTNKDAPETIFNNNGRSELILTNCEKVDSYEPATGKHLWSATCLDGEVAPSAAYADGVVFVANEYAVASAIDIRDHASEPKILWQWEDILPNVSSPVANNYYVIIPSSYGIVNCLDAKTEAVLWEHEFDEGFYSSPVLVKDRVYITDFSGNTQIFRMDKEFHLLGTSALGKEVFATPTFVGNRIFIRGTTHLFAVGEKSKEDEEASR